MIAQNIVRIRSQIISACNRAGRDAQDVTLVAVTKGRSVEEIRTAIAAGITDIGENRVQEALAKRTELGVTPSVRWHMIGHLQTNKVRDAVRLFDLIHSLDSRRLAAQIDAQAATIGKVQDVLIEVKTSGEATKSGVSPSEALSLAEYVFSLRHLSLKGLMTIAPAGTREDARPYFRQLRQIRDQLNAAHPAPYQLRQLSMGMSDDYTVALEESATIIRLGRAVFKES